MAVEFNNNSIARVTPVQEMHLLKPLSDFFVGQVLRAEVIKPLHPDQVLLRVNGRTLTAKTPEQFKSGETLDVKVEQNDDEMIFTILHRDKSLPALKSALLWVLPKQAPPTQLFQLLSQLESDQSLPLILNQQISALLNRITPLSELPRQIHQAIAYSGLFMESQLLEWKRGLSKNKNYSDFKAQCLTLLAALPPNRRLDQSREPKPEDRHLDQGHLPLPGAIPQPFSKTLPFDLSDYSLQGLLHLLREQLEQTLARITAHQINHLTQDHHQDFIMMLDLPIKTKEGIDVIPVKLQKHKADPMHLSQWSMAFALNLPRLGAIQGTVSINSNQVIVKIMTDNQDSLSEINAYESQIRDRLSALGLHLIDWKLQVGLENNQIDVANIRLLDLRI